MDRIVSKIAFYVTARKPLTLLTLPTDTIDAIVRFLPGKRRVATFGTWRRSRRYHQRSQRGGAPSTNDVP